MAVRDALATQRRILNAALKEFAAKGIAGARVDAIATRARTNKRMLYYYFGSKEGLFREILRQRLARSHERREELEELDYPERLAARQVVTTDSREHIRLLMWEALETRSRKHPVMAEAERLELYEQLRTDVRAAQEAGALPAGLDVDQLVLTEMAVTIFPAAFPQITRLVTGKTVDDPSFVAERAEFLRKYAEHLAARSRV
jgi:TetR/AcrR family transcriptional regulator